MNVADYAQLGRLHPLVLHLPIGFLLAALWLEVLATRGKLERPALALFLWLAALSAALAAATGWVLGHEADYGGATFERHRQLGIALAILAVLAALLHPSSGAGRRLGLYRAALLAACALLVPAGHLGSTLTHGSDWLAGPRVRTTTEVELGTEVRAPSNGSEGTTLPVPTPEGASVLSGADTYATVFAAFFEARCTSCHGHAKHKGGLRLDSYAAMLAGGDDGPALVPGDPAASLLLQRVKLPLEHEDHMPPEGKPQPTPAELAALEAWIAASAPSGAAAALPSSATTPPAPSAPAPAPPEPRGASIGPPPQAPALAAPLAPPAAALAALDQAFVHHERLDRIQTDRTPADPTPTDPTPTDPTQAELWIDVAAVAPTFGDAEFQRLLVPLAPWTVELSLARSAVTDAVLTELARFPRLVRLDLRATRVSGAGVRALGPDSGLLELNLAQTKVTDAAVDALLGLRELRTLELWGAGLTPAGLARLRAAARPELRVNAGDEPAAEALEGEGELVFTSDRPLPGAELVPEALRPINATCPVSGSPVNPKYALVYTSAHGTRVIGFCCPNCPKEFWSDPARFDAKLP